MHGIFKGDLMRRTIPFLLLLIALHPAHALAAKLYFNPERIPAGMLAAPAPLESADFQQQLAYIIQLQQHISQQDIDAAVAEKVMAVELMTQTLPAGMTRQTHPAVFQLLDNVDVTTDAISNREKDFWHMKRPYDLSPQVKALVPPINNPAYPSGHTARSFALMYVMSMLIPSMHDVFYARAQAIADHRVMAGVHSPQDIRCGKEIALISLGSLLQNKNFLDDLAAAKAEIH
jgi:hypothetical protein